jgi:hypothetical protein
MQETRTIEGFERYTVSRYGDVFSKGVRRINQRPINHYGHLAVHLYKGGVRVSRLVHRLVAEAFLQKPDGLDFIDHIDGDPSNNRLENLRWVNPRMNACNQTKLTRKNKTGIQGVSENDTHFISFWVDDERRVRRRVFKKTNPDALAQAIQARQQAVNQFYNRP